MNPPLSHHPRLCEGIRDALECWRSEQVDPPVSLGYSSRDVTADIHPAGDPGWGQDPLIPLAKGKV